MKNLQRVFNYHESQVRTITKDGEQWFVAKDVCVILELGDTHKAVERLDDDERSLIPVTDSLGRQQEMYVINEPGLYSLIIGSRKKEANEFKRWITHDVIPALRRTGMYQVAPNSTESTALQAARQLLLVAEDHGKRIETVETRVDTLEVTVKKEVLITNRQATTIKFATASRIRELLPEDYAARSKQYFSWLYREIYARFAVPSYRDIPRSEFDSVMRLIRDWAPVREFQKPA